tara:strand:+ start:14355 stop:15086 length:732 start_codon:yes stop_codon:yes gene_type:complete
MNEFPYDINRYFFDMGVSLNRRQSYFILYLKKMLRYEKDIIKMFLDKGICFIHIPKNGGSSVVDALYGAGIPHHSALYHSIVHGKVFKRMPSFAIWRDPVSRFVSSYFYLRDYSSFPADREFASRVYGSTDSPLSLIDRMMEDEVLKQEILRWPHFSPQYSFVSDLSGQVIVDWIADISHMEAVSSELSKITSSNVVIGRKNEGKRASYSDEEFTCKVRSLYSRDSLIYEKIRSSDNGIVYFS